MASIVRNEQRGTWQIQWRKGARWVRATAARKRHGWKAGDPMPKKPPAEVQAALLKYQKLEDESRQSGGGVGGADTVAGFLAAYRAFYETARRPTSVLALGQATARFLEFCKAEKIAAVEQVTPEAADRFVAWRRKSVGHDAAKRDVNMLAGAWSRAIKLRALSSNPWKGVEVPGRAKRRKSSWTPGEFDTLMEHARPWLRDLLVLGVNTGLRISALAGLEWPDVKWRRGEGPGFGEVVVRPELDKAKCGYSVPMSSALHDALARLSAERGGVGRVVVGQAGEGLSSKGWVATAIRRACLRAGLPDPDSPCHAMRRTFGRWAVLGHLTGRPVPLYVVSRWMGHHSVSQTEKYLDLSDKVSQEWMTGGGA